MNRRFVPIKSARRVTLSAFLAILMILVSVAGVFALNTPPGSVDQRSWDPSGSVWSGGTGENKGWWEGETAAMVAGISTDVGTEYTLPICLEVWKPPKTDAFGFTKFAPFNFSFAHVASTGRNVPTTLPSGDPIPSSFPATNWDTDDASVWGFNINISTVVPLALGAGGCGPNEIGMAVTYTRTNNNTASYIVWGGHIAQAGDPLPSGAPATVVPTGQSAHYINGNFQGRLKTAAADKTLSFVVNFGPNAVTLSSLAASAGVPVFGFVLVGLFVLVGGGLFGWKRLQKK